MQHNNITTIDNQLAFQSYLFLFPLSSIGQDVYVFNHIWLYEEVLLKNIKDRRLKIDTNT